MLAELVGKQIEITAWDIDGTSDVLAYEDGMFELRAADRISRAFKAKPFWTTAGHLGTFRIKEAKKA